MNDSIISNVVCSETSLYKIASNEGTGVEAVTSQSLTYVSQKQLEVVDKLIDLVEYSIYFEYDNADVVEIETEDFSINSYLTDMCANASENGLSLEHSQKFKDLITTFKQYNKEKLLELYSSMGSKCELAR
jgi:hypothetical protein